MEHKEIELPKFVCEWLDKRSLNYYPIRIVAVIYINHLSDPVDVQDWLNDSVANQWKLIDALRYGYEPEPEPRWGIKHKGAYLHNLIKTEKPSQLATYFNFDDGIYSAYTGSRKIVEEQRDYLGFGEVIDLNKEGKADD